MQGVHQNPSPRIPHPRGSPEQFRAALLLRKYKFGAQYVAKYLHAPRGLIQSWLSMSEKHALAEQRVKTKAFESIVGRLRSQVTLDNMDYLLMKELQALGVSDTCTSRLTGIPTSTVRSWRAGTIPKGFSGAFVDEAVLARELEKAMRRIKRENTAENMLYRISMRLAKEAAQVSDDKSDKAHLRGKIVGRGPVKEATSLSDGKLPSNKSTGAGLAKEAPQSSDGEKLNGKSRKCNRSIGGALISQILNAHYNLNGPLSKGTVTYWIEGRRTPPSAFLGLADEDMIYEEYSQIVDALTHRYMNYHLAKRLYDEHDWPYNHISAELGEDKERVRGWVIKGRCPPIAKVYINEDIIQAELKKRLEPKAENPGQNIQNASKIEGAPKTALTIHESKCANMAPPHIANISCALSEDENMAKSSINAKLEDEIVYHLGTIPGGVSSPETIGAILIENKKCTVEDIKNVLTTSKKIAFKRGRWMLKEDTPADSAGWKFKPVK